MTSSMRWAVSGPAVSERSCIGPVVLPYLAGLALSMHRLPGGADTPGFWRKHLPGHRRTVSLAGTTP